MRALIGAPARCIFREKTFTAYFHFLTEVRLVQYIQQINNTIHTLPTAPCPPHLHEGAHHAVLAIAPGQALLQARRKLVRLGQCGCLGRQAARKGDVAVLQLADAALDMSTLAEKLSSGSKNYNYTRNSCNRLSVKYLINSHYL